MFDESLFAAEVLADSLMQFQGSNENKWARVADSYTNLFGGVSQGRRKALNRAKTLNYKRANEKAVTALVRKQLRRSKVQKLFTNVMGVTQWNSALTGTDALFLLNAIPKGTDDYQRDGDSIALRKIVVDANVSLTSLSASQNTNVWVTMLVMYCKTTPQATSANLPWTSLLDVNGAYQGWTGLASDRLMDMNTDDFGILFRKDCKMSLNATYTAGIITAGATDSISQYANFHCAIPYNDKHVSYEAGLNSPSVYNPFVVFCLTGADCTTNAVFTTATINTNIVSKITFVDDN